MPPLRSASSSPRRSPVAGRKAARRAGDGQGRARQAAADGVGQEVAEHLKESATEAVGQVKQTATEGAGQVADTAKEASEARWPSFTPSAILARSPSSTPATNTKHHLEAHQSVVSRRSAAARKRFIEALTALSALSGSRVKSNDRNATGPVANIPSGWPGSAFAGVAAGLSSDNPRSWATVGDAFSTRGRRSSSAGTPRRIDSSSTPTTSGMAASIRMRRCQGLEHRVRVHRAAY